MGKKRLIINIILTIFILIISNSLYLTFEPIKINFKVEQANIEKEDIALQLLYQKEGRKSFRVKYSEKFILQKSDEVTFKINAFFVHKLKLDICLSNTENISITDIKVNNIEASNLFLNDDIEITGGKLEKVNNSSLKIIPDTNNIVLEIDDLKLLPLFNIDLKIMLTIGVLAFFTLFKLLNYLAALKYEHKHSRINIIFVAACFTLLFIPMMRINDDDISKEERRTLAKKPKLIVSNRVNLEYGKNFESFFNDRFFGRSYVVEEYNRFCNLLNNNNDSQNIVGKDGWRFYNDDSFNGRRDFQNTDKFTSQELEHIKKYLEYLNNYCKKNNKKFYYYIAPNKNKVYGEFFDDNTMKINPDEESKTWQLINYLKENTDIKVIYPIKELLAAKKNAVLYYKNDTHWTALGAYYGYLALMKEIKKDFDVKIIEPIDYTFKANDPKDLIKTGDIYDETFEYKIPVFANNAAVKINVDTFDAYSISRSSRVTTYNSTQKLNLVMYRDSFACSWPVWLGESFQNTTYWWRTAVVASDFAVLKDADVVVFESVERLVPRILDVRLIETKGDE